MKVRAAGRVFDVKTTLTDRLVGWLNPHAGMERLKARTMMALAVGNEGGYRGGRRDRRSTRGWRPKEASADTDILVDLPDLRARSRDLVRNTPIATGAIATVVTNVVGEGLVLKAEIDADALRITEEAALAWQAQAEREWEIFCRSADFTGAQDFYEMQGLALRSVLESGDLLQVRRFRKDAGDAYGTKVQFVEADRICNSDRAADTDEITAGVKFTGGVATGYQVANRHPDERGVKIAKELKWADVPIRDALGRKQALLLFDRLRPDQTRGVPYLAPVVEALKTLGDYTDAEVRAAVVSAMFTVFLTAPVTDGTGDSVLGSDAPETGVERGKEVLLEDAGAIVELDPGMEPKFADPSRPNAGFDPFVIAVLRQVGVALELPFELLVKHFTASYSAARAALEMAWQFFRKRRSFVAWRVCQPVYEWFLDEAVASGRLIAPGFFDDPLIRQAYCGAEWIGPSRINLDPKKEAEADEIDLRMRVKTRAQIVTERTGGTWDRKHRQLVREEEAAKKDGLQAEALAAGKSGEPPTDHPDEPEEEDEN